MILHVVLDCFSKRQIDSLYVNNENGSKRLGCTDYDIADGLYMVRVEVSDEFFKSQVKTSDDLIDDNGFIPEDKSLDPYAYNNMSAEALNEIYLKI
jgi:hypothetical protein